MIQFNLTASKMNRLPIMCGIIYRNINKLAVPSKTTVDRLGLRMIYNNRVHTAANLPSISRALNPRPLNPVLNRSAVQCTTFQLRKFSKSDESDKKKLLSWTDVYNVVVMAVVGGLVIWICSDIKELYDYNKDIVGINRAKRIAKRLVKANEDKVYIRGLQPELFYPALRTHRACCRTFTDTPDDHQLAYIIAHKMAHLNFEALGKKSTAADFEAAADEHALEIMTAAGYDQQRALRYLNSGVTEK